MTKPTPIYRSILFSNNFLRNFADEVLAIASVAREVENLVIFPFVASLVAYSIYFFMGKRCPSNLCTLATTQVVLVILTY